MKMFTHDEAYIDFQIDNVSDHVTNKIFSQLKLEAGRVIQEIDGYLDRGQLCETNREGFYVAIAGPPNADKSTLVNLIAGR